EKTEPDFVRFGTCGPEVHKLAQVCRPLRHLPCDRAVDRDGVSCDIFQNPVISGGLSPGVMFRLQAVNRNDDQHMLQPRPLAWNLPHRAGHDVRSNAARIELRQNFIELTKPDERFAADDRDVQWLMTIEE